MKKMTERAMLVDLRIHLWTGTKNDPAVSASIDHAHQTRNAGKYTKILIDGNEFADIRMNASKIRKCLYHHTLPWNDAGERLLPADNYFTFVDEFSTLKSAYNNACERFYSRYSLCMNNAQKRLNGLYRPADYPGPGELRNRYGLQIVFMPIADPCDFRVQVGEEIETELRVEMERELTERFNRATRHLAERMQTAVAHMVTRLSDKDAVFRDTLVNNLEALVEALPRLNFMQDPALSSITQDIRALLISPDLLRTDDNIRHSTSAAAQAVLDKINHYLA